MRRSLLFLPVLLLAACAAPGRVEIGSLRMENRTEGAVAVAARWHDADTGTCHVFEALLPPQGSDMWARLEEDLPAGTHLQFASRGEGYAAVCRRQGLQVEALDGELLTAAAAEVGGMHWVGLHRTSSSQQQEGGEIPDAEAAWTYPGGEGLVVVERAADGTLTLRTR